MYSINGVKNSVLDYDVKYIYSNPYAFVAIKNNDDIITWGDIDYGGTINNDTLVSESLLQVSLFEIIDGSFQMPLVDYNEDQRTSFASSIQYIQQEKKAYVGITDFDTSNNGCIKVFQYNDVSFVEVSNNILSSDKTDMSFNRFGIQFVNSYDSNNLNNPKITIVSKPLHYSNNYIESFQYYDGFNKWLPIHFDICGISTSIWEHERIDKIFSSEDGNVIAVSDMSNSNIFTFHYESSSNTYKHYGNEIFDASFSPFNN